MVGVGFRARDWLKFKVPAGSVLKLPLTTTFFEYVPEYKKNDNRFEEVDAKEDR